MLTPKQQRFVKEYLVDLNATQAATRAGYSTKTAAAMGHENLRKPEIAKAVEAAQQTRSKKLDIDAEWVVKRLAKVYGLALKENLDTSRKALRDIGEHLGMFKETIDVNATHTHYVVHTPPKGASREAWQQLYSRN